VLRSAAASLNEASKSRLAELGTEHPQAFAVIANMASAEIMVARAEHSPIRMERAIDVLEVASIRLAAELGADHPQARAATAGLAAARAEPPIASQDLGRARKGGEEPKTALASQALLLADPPEPPATFGALLRRRRLGAGLTQRELARASYRSERSIRALERGTDPPGGAARTLADALGLADAARAEFLAAARGGAVSAASGAAIAVTLPRDVASFTGRQVELEELANAAAGAGGVVIHAIEGMAGVGKTAFAVHAAHQLAAEFPDGQIFLPLHGHTPGQRPVNPVDALGSLLLTAGVPASQIPATLEARRALWRARMTGRRLLVLDDAASSDQIRPLLPAAGGSLVLVTSRRRLSALDSARTVSLETLPSDEAAALLVRLTGRTELSPDDQGVAEVIRMCEFLPLAIGMAARQLHHDPSMDAAGHAAELATARNRLRYHAGANLPVAAAFDLSYANLTAERQRLFRRLGLHPGTDIDAFAAAALDGTDRAAAQRGLDGLVDRHLITQPTAGRYKMHDLIREYSRTLDPLDELHDRAGATTRLLAYYQDTAALADAIVTGQSSPDAGAAESTTLASLPNLTGREEALAWARAERASMMACLDYAAANGQHGRVTALTAALAGLLRRDGLWDDAVARHTTAIGAARHLGDRIGEADALSNLGDALRLAGDHPSARRELEQALGIYRDLGHQLGQAKALSHLGDLSRLTGDMPAAGRNLEQALAIYQELGHRPGQAHALYRLGGVRLVGNLPAAAETLEQALAIYGELGDELGQANALSDLGAARRETGDSYAAAQALEQALVIYQDLGHRPGQADALVYLGAIKQQTGDLSAAAQDLEQALAIYQDLGQGPGEASALSYLGVICRQTADYPTAARAQEQALAIYQDLGDRAGEADALNELGILHRVGGDLAQAEQCHQRALALAGEIASPWHVAHALNGLGQCAQDNGQAVKAQDLLRQAVEIFQRLSVAEAADRGAEPDGLTSRPRAR
jgi:tetratricopeptide (TPR) repeat protein/transcriptional regulator with XRE-family HTH domain